MKLDLTSLQKAIASLDEALNAQAKDPDNGFIMDSCIQRFEFTYELSWKTLKRYLEMSEASSQDIDSLAFPDLIRIGNEKGLLKSDWPSWKKFRESRNKTAHTYDAQKAKEVFLVIPDFLTEARALFENIQSKISHG
jgi:nucleotidyltransferase substrate binding protein (TIGR01987 family)